MEYKNGMVYMVVNKENGKIYIGATIKSLEATRQIHYKSNLKTSNSLFYADLRKYPKEVFEWSVIESGISEKKLGERENFYIKKYNAFCDWPNSNGYNEMCEGVRSKRFKQKRSSIMRGSSSVGKSIYCPEVNRFFQTTQDAADFAGVSRSAIKNILSGFSFRTKSGFHFEWRSE